MEAGQHYDILLSRHHNSLLPRSQDHVVSLFCISLGQNFTVLLCRCRVLKRLHMGEANVSWSGSVVLKHCELNRLHMRELPVLVSASSGFKNCEYSNFVCIVLWVFQWICTHLCCLFARLFGLSTRWCLCVFFNVLDLYVDLAKGINIVILVYNTCLMVWLVKLCAF